MAHNNPKRKQRDGEIKIEKVNVLRQKVLNAILIVFIAIILIITFAGAYLAYLTFGDKIGAASVAVALTEGLIHSPSTFAAYAIAVLVPLFVFVNTVAASILIWIELVGHIRKFLGRVEL